MTYGMVPLLPCSSLGSSDGQETRQLSPALAAAELLEGERPGAPVHRARSLQRGTSDRQSTAGGGRPRTLPQTPLQRRWDRRTFTNSPAGSETLVNLSSHLLDLQIIAACMSIPPANDFGEHSVPLSSV